MSEKEKIVLGSGLLYCMEYTGTIPENSAIETAANLLGKIKGGASLTYTPAYYEAKDDLRTISKKIITTEDVTLLTGLITWTLATLNKMCDTGEVVETAGIRTLKIGGAGRASGKSWLLHFLHKDAKDGDIRATIIGSNQKGFTLSFAQDKETTIDAEFKAEPMDDDGTLVILQEEIANA